MTYFPTSEPKIKRFCDRMLDGLMWHGPDFPHVNRMSLTTKRSVLHRNSKGSCGSQIAKADSDEGQK